MVRKRIPKKAKPVSTDAARLSGEASVNQAVVKLFFIESSTAIFDSAYFTADFYPSSVWTTKRNRPTTRIPSFF